MTEHEIQLSAEQHGIILKEMLSFILAQNGKAKVNDVHQHMLASQNNEFSDEMVETLSRLSVQAEWLKKSGNWSLTNHGKQALEAHTSPKTLFQTLVIQSLFRRNETASSQKHTRNLFYWLVGLQILCLLIGLIDSSKIQVHAAQLYLLGATVCSSFLSVLFSGRRDRLLLASQFFRIETIALFTTFVADIFLALSTYKIYVLNLLEISLLIQILAWFLAWKYPGIASSALQIIGSGRNNWFWIIGLLVFSLLFGGRGFPRYKGLIYYLYGSDVSLISWSIVVVVFSFFGILLIIGDWISQLKSLGYFE